MLIKKFKQKLFLFLFFITIVMSSGLFSHVSLAHANEHIVKSRSHSHIAHISLKHNKSAAHQQSYNSIAQHHHYHYLQTAHNSFKQKQGQLHGDSAHVKQPKKNHALHSAHSHSYYKQNIIHPISHDATLEINNNNLNYNNNNYNSNSDSNVENTSSDLSLPKPFEAADSSNLSAQACANISTRQKLVALVNKAIDALHYTSYRLGGSYFDLSRGIYEEDCSGYVDQLLHQAEPLAFAALTRSTHSQKPSSFDYYDFFKRLPNTGWRFWRKIEDVANLNPGAILVFRYLGHSRFGTGGHVMVVMSKPIPIENDANAFLVRVSDSASSGHSNDTRACHMSGVGIGTLLLRVNPFTRKPSAFAWNLHSFERSAQVAMAEPINFA